MDDLSEKLDRLLGSEDGMKRIGELMGALGGAPPAAAPASPPSASPPAAPPALPDMGMLLKLLPLLTQLSQEDENAALLHALRPHLTDERQKRLDEAGQLLKLARMLPLLTELKKGEDADG